MQLISGIVIYELKVKSKYCFFEKEKNLGLTPKLS